MVQVKCTECETIYWWPVAMDTNFPFPCCPKCDSRTYDLPMQATANNFRDAYNAELDHEESQFAKTILDDEYIREFAYKVCTHTHTALAFEQFLNILRLLRSIDRNELVEAGAIENEIQWQTFRSNPYDWLIAYASDEQARAVWGIIEGRMSKCSA